MISRDRKVSFSISIRLDQVEKLEFLGKGQGVSKYLQEYIDKEYEKMIEEEYLRRESERA